jgi:hypothetical protein
VALQALQESIKIAPGHIAKKIKIENVLTICIFLFGSSGLKETHSVYVRILCDLLPGEPLQVTKATDFKLKSSYFVTFL